MVMLHLVRHARSAQTPSLPSWEWPLTDDAKDGAARLRAAGVLPPAALWVSSSEPKARATAALLTSSDVDLDDGLREAHRDPAWLDGGEFERLVLRSFAEPDVSVRTGWESLAQTRTRVVEAARGVLDRACGRDVVLVGHGTAWTMLVAGLTDSPPDVEAWQAMRMPDHCALVWPPDGVATAWGSWAA